MYLQISKKTAYVLEYYKEIYKLSFINYKKKTVSYFWAVETNPAHPNTARFLLATVPTACVVLQFITDQ